MEPSLTKLPIEPTPSMIEAGKRALIQEIGFSGDLRGISHAELAELVFREMIQQQRVA